MKRKLGILFVILFTAFSCAKDNGDNIPSVPVNFQAAITDTRISKLSTPGNAVVVSGYGVAGLLIYHDYSGSYRAYDRCSSYQPQNKCAVTIDDTGFTVTDPCSGSKFSLNDGSPVKAPATKSLRIYDAYVSNSQLFVQN